MFSVRRSAKSNIPMPLVEKWTLPPSKTDGRYREFESRAQYLDYLRGRRRVRLADKRFRLAREAAFDRVYRSIHRVSSWSDVAHLLTQHNREFKLLLDDPEFEIKSCAFTLKSQDSVRWVFNLKMELEDSHVLMRRERKGRLQSKREALDLPKMYDRSIVDVLKDFEINTFMLRVGNVFNTDASVLKRAFPDIAVMEIMTAPPKKMVIA